MSLLPDTEPTSRKGNDPAVAVTIQGRPRDLGDGFTVQRVLPSIERRMIGPFIFFDQMGPVAFAEGRGLDVRPHPHINLATVTYLFEGEILHRDSLGSEQPIRPGAVNWMTAGRGIAHSERTPAAERKAGRRLHGLQLWCALPREHEETAPTFQHVAKADVPVLQLGGARLRLVAGSAYGAISPVRALSPLFYADAELERDAELALPDEHAARAVYVLAGTVACQGNIQRAGEMVVFHSGAAARVRACEPARIMALGGAPLDGERHIWWNFVSSSLERIERAKDDWRARRFAAVAGDDAEFIPLPEPRHTSHTHEP
jgi:redox-sensitive bicupin YhaK (pirin superfamily)